MAEGLSPDLMKKALKHPTNNNLHNSRELPEIVSTEEQLSPLLEIKSMHTLDPADTRRASSEKGIRKLKLKKNSEPDDKCLSKATSAIAHQSRGQPPAQECLRRDHSGQSRSKPPVVQATKQVKKPSQATFLDDFPELAPVGRKLSASLSPPVLQQLHNRYSTSPNTDLLPFYMQHFMPPLEYLHRCMPVSYRLKGSPNTKDQPNVSNYFQDSHFHFPLHSVLQPSPPQSKREITDYCEFRTKMQSRSSSKGCIHTRMVKKTLHKLISIPSLPMKGIPKVRS